MFRPTWLIALGLLAAQQRPCAAQTTLEWEPAETTFLEVRHVAKQEVTVIGRTKETETTVRFLFKVRPTKIGREATAYEITVVGCEDSSTTKGAAPEKDTFKGFRGQTFRVTVGAGNRGLDIADAARLAEAVFGDEVKGGTEAEKRFAADMTEAVVRIHLLDAFVPLPGKAVAPGDKWRDTAEVKVQPIAQVTIDREYGFAGGQVHEGKRVEAVNWASRVEFKPLGDDKGGLPFTVKEMKAVGKPRNEGTVLWDGAARRPVRIDSLQVYEIEMLMVIDGKEVKGKGKGSDTFVIRFFAKNPDEK
jgi:hypothetical protein